MNTENSAHSTLFRDRDLRTTRTLNTPTRFSTEPEGEGLDLCLRAVLVACLVAAMFCGVSPDRFANVHAKAPALPDTHTAVAMVQPHAAPVAKTL